MQGHRVLLFLFQSESASPGRFVAHSILLALQMLERCMHHWSIRSYKLYSHAFNIILVANDPHA